MIYKQQSKLHPSNVNILLDIIPYRNLFHGFDFNNASLIDIQCCDLNLMKLLSDKLSAIRSVIESLEIEPKDIIYPK